MKRLLIALAFLLLPSAAFAQCNGVFPNQTVCGNVTGAGNLPRPTSPSAFLGAAGGTNGQTQYNNSGVLGGYTPGQDCTVNTTTGAFTCTKTNNVAFSPLATATIAATTNGGTAANNSTNTANDVLASNGANGSFVHTALLTVINSVCTLTPITCSNLFGFMKPEWYGAVPSPYPTAAGSIANSQTAIQNAINAVTANGGGTILFTGVYGVGTGITAGTNIILKGIGIHNSTLLLQPTADNQVAVVFAAGAAMVSNCGFYDMQIASADTTFAKVGLEFQDVSRCNVNNIMITAYPNGNFTGPSASGRGLITLGRELTNVSNYQIYADSPIIFYANPNFAGNSEDLDSWHFWNGHLVAPLTGATTHVMTVSAGVAPFNLHMDGYQDWSGGVDGFSMTGTSTLAASGIYISGIKDEQAGATGGYSVHIAPSGGVYNVNISGLIGVRNGIFLQHTNQAFISAFEYDASTSTTKVGLNADITNSSITFSGCTWITGTTATLGAFTNSNWITPTGSSTALPASGVSWH